MGFQKKSIPIDTLKKYGFESEDEFNSFRYSDYCIKQFIESAKKENYFSNTIFVFVGDHGLAGDATAVYPAVWTEQRLTDQHVPLLFYAPDMLTPAKKEETVSQIDVLPTIAGLLHRPYENRTLGRDLLDPKKKNDFAFITNTADAIGVVTNDFYFVKNVNSGEEQVYSLKGNSIPAAKLSAEKEQLSSLTNALFETAKYLLLNNKKH